MKPDQFGAKNTRQGAAEAVPILLIAGLGHLDSNCTAAAVALKRFPAAELAFASKAALPDILEARAPERGEVKLLGVSLTGNPGRLEEVLGSSTSAEFASRGSASRSTSPPHFPTASSRCFRRPPTA